MRLRTVLISLLLVLIPASRLCAQELSFEDGLFPAECGRASRVKVSGQHYKMGEKSLEWSWNRKNAELVMRVPVKYQAVNPNPKETSISSFVFWVYSPSEQPGKILFTFRKDGRDCCWFEYNLGFKGWRGAWVAFDRDMQGTPEEDMDEIVIRPSESKGTLYFDGVIPAVFEDARYHSPDFQLPEVNRGTDVHWLMLMHHWSATPPVAAVSVGKDDIASQMETIRQRYIRLVGRSAKSVTRDEVEAFYRSFNLKTDPSKGYISGKPIFFTRYAETYFNLGDTGKSAQWKANGQLLRDFNDFMFRIAATWVREPDGEYKDYLAQVYTTLTWHLLDQGMACGSGMGTIHHLGYSIRGWYNSQVLMKPVLEKVGLLHDVQQAVEWYSGSREVWTAPSEPGMDIDAFNTYLLGRVAAVLLLPDDAYKYTYMKSLSAWIDNGFKYSPGFSPCFKPDGTVFHHCRNYPAYAIGGFTGAVRSVWLLRGTDFRISSESHEILKNAMLQMRFYCNTVDIPFAMAGRHPEGGFTLDTSLYALLADAGSPDGTLDLDTELASAYLRLENKNTAYAKAFAKAGIAPEQAPTGCRSYGYNSSVSVRGGEWLVNIAGHSRYLWAAETYQRENMYGRYLTHGSMQYIKGSPQQSGYVQAGWDWCHIPGTTAAVLPMEQMRANVLNVDKYSGYEEMLLSDEWFAGGVAAGTNAAYSMILHEHDKYNGSLRARKSFFVFGNRIVCLGSGLQNHKSGCPLHTTLFQNSIEPLQSADSMVVANGTLLRDRLGNAWIVAGGQQVLLRRSLQHSYAENDSGPNQGWFETAYIDHGLDVSEGAYEYIFIVQADDEQLRRESASPSYKVLSATNSLHHVQDMCSGIHSAAVFETSSVSELVRQASPCVMMYKTDNDGKALELDFCNPDLALYSGESDEKFDSDGKRVERSVYSRGWIHNACALVEVSFTLEGRWSIDSQSCTVSDIHYAGGMTYITAQTSEARTEHLSLRKDQ